MAKRDVGMAGSSGYDSEFYTQNSRGSLEPNTRTMKLQGMGPKQRMADSIDQENRVRRRARVGLPMTDKDKARMQAVSGSTKGLFGSDSPEIYNEDKLQANIYRDNSEKREKAYTRNMAANETINKQKAQASVASKFGDNSFKPYQSTMPTLSKQIMNANAKRK